MPFRAFGLFRRKGNSNGHVCYHSVLMPFRAFGLFRPSEPRCYPAPSPCGLNALPGVRSIPTEAREFLLEGPCVCLNALPGVRSIPTVCCLCLQRGEGRCVLMPFRAFGLFRLSVADAIREELTKVLMPFRAFGLFRQGE